ncbi:MAG: adenosylcobinamide-GDP ribazoletransferase [Dehalococcoidia bacterium]|nr:adenosylcobinamide-GDP ribazoletransferase [Dehalococcoidia bacterium]
MSGPLAAVALLTALPVPGRLQAHGAGLGWFAVAGLLVGALAAGCWLLAAWVWPGTLVPAALAVTALAMVTGMLHLDDLADAADAALAPVDQERRIAILHDVHHGTFGVVAVGLVLLLQLTALSACSSRHGALLLLVSPAAARAMLPLAMRVLPPLAESRMAATARNGASNGAVGASLACSFLIAAALGSVAGLIVSAVVLGSAAGVAGLCAWRFGGLNGDALGAAVELSQTAGLLAGAAILAHPGVRSGWGLP